MKVFWRNSINQQQLLIIMLILALSSTNSSKITSKSNLEVENCFTSPISAETMTWWWQLMLNTPKTYLNNNQHDEAIMPNPYVTSFKIDENFIRSRIMGKTEYRKKFATLIWQARAGSKEVENYIDLGVSRIHFM